MSTPEDGSMRWEHEVLQNLHSTGGRSSLALTSAAERRELAREGLKPHGEIGSEP